MPPPGDPGTVYGDANFWDYGIVEATNDGITWKALLPGYDAKEDAAWLGAFSGGQPGVSSIFATRSINILNTFSAGDNILIRFRLFVYGAANGWGWAIDDLKI